MTISLSYFQFSCKYSQEKFHGEIGRGIVAFKEIAEPFCRILWDALEIVIEIYIVESESESEFEA